MYNSGAASPDAPRVPEPALSATSTRPLLAWPRLVEAAGGEEVMIQSRDAEADIRHQTQTRARRAHTTPCQPLLQCNSQIMQKEESSKNPTKRLPRELN